MTGHWSVPFIHFDQKQAGSKPFSESRERTRCHSLPLSMSFVDFNFLLLLGLGTAFQGLSVSTFNPLWGCVSVLTITVPWFICALGHKCHLSKARHWTGYQPIKSNVCRVHQQCCCSTELGLGAVNIVSSLFILHMKDSEEEDWQGSWIWDLDSGASWWRLWSRKAPLNGFNLFYNLHFITHTKKEM